MSDSSLPCQINLYSRQRSNHAVPEVLEKRESGAHGGDGVENDCTLAAWMLLKLSQYQIAVFSTCFSEAFDEGSRAMKCNVISRYLPPSLRL